MTPLSIGPGHIRRDSSVDSVRILPFNKWNINVELYVYRGNGVIYGEGLLATLGVPQNLDMANSTNKPCR